MEVISLEAKESFTMEGMVTKYIFRGEDFSVAVFRYGSEETVIAGSLYSLPEKERIRVFGEWTTHAKYGRQVKVTHWECPVPNTKEQAIIFLSSGLIKGVGPITAKRIVNKLGANAVEIIIKKGPDALAGIKGLTKIQEAYECIRDRFEIQKVMQQLLPAGMTVKTIIKAHKKFGVATVGLVKKNPYILMDIDSIGFKTADEIAKRFGVALDSSSRISGAIKYSLQEAMQNNGHCFLKVEELIENTIKVLNEKEDLVKEAQIRAVLGSLAQEHLVVDEGAVYFPYLYTAEVALADKIRFLVGKKGTRVPEIDRYIKGYELLNKIQLAEEQKQAVAGILANDIFIITGGPGVGKTTSVKTIIDIYKRLYPEAEVLLASPTGKASRRLSDVTGMDASTIHRLLGFVPGQIIPLYNHNNPLPCDLLVVDEWSMVSLRLAKLLFDAVGNNTKVLLVGDVDQLQSVDPGNVLKDMLSAGVPCVKLEKIFRQASESQIIIGAHTINKGKPFYPDHTKGDFFFLEKEEPEQITNTIVKSVERLIKTGYGLDDIQVMSPIKQGPVGAIELNKRLQQLINPPKDGEKEIVRGGTVFRIGDKVICIKNNYDKGIFNGETGVIDRLSRGEEGEINGLVIRFTDREVAYLRGELQEIDLAYCITTHKSQGSEFKVALMPLTTSHYIMLMRTLFYTGLTRAKERIVLVGTKKAMNIAVRNNGQAKRNTRLAGRISGNMYLEFDKEVV